MSGEPEDPGGPRPDWPATEPGVVGVLVGLEQIAELGDRR